MDEQELRPMVMEMLNYAEGAKEDGRQGRDLTF